MISAALIIRGDATKGGRLIYAKPPWSSPEMISWCFFSGSHISSWQKIDDAAVITHTGMYVERGLSICFLGSSNGDFQSQTQ